MQDTQMLAGRPAVAGAVYGVILNDRGSLAKFGARLDEVPYKGAPRAPVLYIKPANTVVGNGSTVCLPAGETQVEIGATLGIVIGRPAARLRVEDAQAVIAGYMVVADLSLPHASYYRPAIREKCFDGACPVGDDMASAAAVGAIGALALRTYVDGTLIATRRLDDLVRAVPELLRDVTGFMTLRTGDVLLVGVEYQAPQAAAGARVRVEADRVGAVEFLLAAQEQGTQS